VALAIARWMFAKRRVIAASLAALSVGAVGLLTYGIVGVITAAGQRPSGSSQPLMIGFARVDRRAPGFRLPDLRGDGHVTVPGLAGRPVVVNFWSSSCDVCKTEASALAEAARATSGRVTFLGVDTFDQRLAAMAFVDRYRVPYRIAFDPRGTAAASYRLPGLPVTFFLAASRRTIVGVNYGALTTRSLARILRTLYGA
jgi:cytochrome c biogenesis protein CcmG/thiol:disulfide interchange protein DsbE